MSRELGGRWKPLTWKAKIDEIEASTEPGGKSVHTGGPLESRIKKASIESNQSDSKESRSLRTDTEHCLRAAGSELGVAGQQLDCIVNLQMKVIRQVVTDIDFSRNPKGGTALRRSGKGSFRGDLRSQRPS
jgi:hypothetical protein